MKKSGFCAVLFVLAILIGCACGKRSSDTELSYGTYVGVLPCADCSGILTHVSINRDSTAVISRLYYGSDSIPETKHGTWTYAEGIITVKIPWEELYYKVEEDTAIVMVDRRGDVPSVMRDKYRLCKTFYDAGCSD